MVLFDFTIFHKLQNQKALLRFTQHAINNCVVLVSGIRDVGIRWSFATTHQRCHS